MLKSVVNDVYRQLTERLRLEQQYGPGWEAKLTDELLQKIQTEARVNPCKYNGRE
jgi:hypothetical protein